MNNDKVIIIPKENKNVDIFTKIIRENPVQEEYYPEHIVAIRRYMDLNNIPVSGKLSTDVGNVLLTGDVVIEKSVIDYVFIPFSLDDRQHELLLSYIEDAKLSNDKSFAVHAITKQNGKYKFDSFMGDISDYEKTETMINSRWLSYKIKSMINANANANANVNVNANSVNKR